MNEQQVLERIRTEMRAIKVPGADQATLDSEWEALEVDSLDLVELVRALEDAYGIEIPDERLDGVRNVGDAVTLVIELSGDGMRA